MNFLGHLYLSDDDHELMIHNLFGDFVRGKDLSRFPIAVQQGIRLHREIDDFMDRHKRVVETVHVLQPELPKIAGIAMDLYFDHILSKRWAEYHKKDYMEYLSDFYSKADTSESYFGLSFQLFIKKLVRYNWMSYYPSLDGLDKACKGVSARISFPNALVNGKDVFLKHQTEIERTFTIYMEDAKEKFNIVNSK